MDENKVSELWLDVKDFPGYMISNFGKIVSFKTDKFKPIKKQVINGYVRISLSRSGVVNCKNLGKLVAQHFLPNLQNRKYVKFKDGDKTNCHISNLEWCSRQSIESDLYDKRRERFLEQKS